MHKLTDYCDHPFGIKGPNQRLGTGSRLKKETKIIIRVAMALYVYQLNFGRGTQKFPDVGGRKRVGPNFIGISKKTEHREEKSFRFYVFFTFQILKH